MHIEKKRFRLDDIIFPTGKTSALFRIAPVLILFVAAVLIIFVPFKEATALFFSPDSLEYSIGLANQIDTGRFGLYFNGEFFPSRYPPWFSATVLGPFFILLKKNILYLNIAILAYSLLSVYLIYRMGLKLHSGLIGFFAAFLTIFCPQFIFYSRTVMTEIPYLSVLLLLYFAFIKIIENEKTPRVTYIIIGALIMYCGIIRSTGLTMMGPFILLIVFKERNWAHGIRHVVELTIFPFIFASLSLVYNKLTFGAFFRNGYDFWLPIPHDVPGLLFNAHYIGSNLKYLALDLLMRLVAVMIVICSIRFVFICRKGLAGIRENKAFCSFLVITIYHLIVLCALYLPYYWHDTRFFFYMAFPLFALSLSSIDSFMKKTSCRSSLRILFILFVCAIGAYCVKQKSDVRYMHVGPWRNYEIKVLQIFEENLPESSVLISSFDPVAIDYFLRGKGILQIPFQRTFSHAGMTIAPGDIQSELSTMDLKITDMLNPYVLTNLINSGKCKRALPIVFAETTSAPKSLIANGCRVFIDGLSYSSAKDFVDTSLKLDNLQAVSVGSWKIHASPPFWRRKIETLFTPNTIPMLIPKYNQTDLYEIVKKTSGTQDNETNCL